MTTIIIRKDKEQTYKGIICMGHAEYAEYGSDILCASISTLVISTLNALEDLADEKMTATINEETGFIKCDFDSVLQEKSSFLVDSLVYALKMLQVQYGEQYLQVKFEEV